MFQGDPASRAIQSCFDALGHGDVGAKDSRLAFEKSEAPFEEAPIPLPWISPESVQYMQALEEQAEAVPPGLAPLPSEQNGLKPRPKRAARQKDNAKGAAKHKQAAKGAAKQNQAAKGRGKGKAKGCESPLQRRKSKILMSAKKKMKGRAQPCRDVVPPPAPVHEVVPLVVPLEPAAVPPLELEAPPVRADAPLEPEAVPPLELEAPPVRADAPLEPELGPGGQYTYIHIYVYIHI